jgi:peptidoglycan/LPS O-acetylase OafA/YrhL
VALPLSLLAAEVSWRLVESPALRRKSRYQRVPTGQAPATA